MSLKVENMSFKEGHEMKIAVKAHADFAINIGHDGDNIALHLNPRFDSGQVVCNSLCGGDWGDEHREDQFSFQSGEESKLVINFNTEQFYIKLPDGVMMDFPNRLGDSKYKYITVTGDAKMISLKIK